MASLSKRDPTEIIYSLESAIRSGEHPTHHLWKIKNGKGPKSSRDERGRHLITIADSDEYIARLKAAKEDMPSMVAALMKVGAREAMEADLKRQVPQSEYESAIAESNAEIKAIAGESLK